MYIVQSPLNVNVKKFCKEFSVLCNQQQTACMKSLSVFEEIRASITGVCVNSVPSVLDE